MVTEPQWCVSTGQNRPRAASPARPAPPDPQLDHQYDMREIIAEDPASVERKVPPVARIFRGSLIFHDLFGVRRTTARRRTTAHTGITPGPGHHAGAAQSARRPAQGPR